MLCFSIGIRGNGRKPLVFVGGGNFTAPLDTP